MLDRFEEQEFVNRFHIKGKQKVSVGWAFYCPHCTPSTAKHDRRVGFILTGNASKNYNTFSCRRCGTTYSFRKFLKEHDPSLFKEYVAREKELRLQTLREGYKRKKQEFNELVESLPDLKYVKIPSHFVAANKNVEAYKYCRGRKMPSSEIEKCFFAPYIEVESNGKIYIYKHMLVFPFRCGDNYYGYQARGVREKLFYTNSVEGYKVFNYFGVDYKKPVHILESIIDSFYVDNAIAMIGADLSQPLLDKIKRPIFVFDNDVTNDTFEKMIRYVKRGYEVVIWPEMLREKDVNEMICNGFKPKDVMTIIKNNTHSGYGAVMKIKLLMLKRKRR